MVDYVIGQHTGITGVWQGSWPMPSHGNCAILLRELIQKKKCLRCNWHHVIVQLSNDYSVSSSTYTHVEAWALLPALGRQCWGWPSRHEQWCGCVLTTGWAGPWLNLGVHYTICFFLHHAAKHLGQPHDSCYLLLPLANFLVLSLNLTIPIVS